MRKKKRDRCDKLPGQIATLPFSLVSHETWQHAAESSMKLMQEVDEWLKMSHECERAGFDGLLLEFLLPAEGDASPALIAALSMVSMLIASNESLPLGLSVPSLPVGLVGDLALFFGFDWMRIDLPDERAVLTSWSATRAKMGAEPVPCIIEISPVGMNLPLAMLPKFLAELAGQLPNSLVGGSLFEALAFKLTPTEFESFEADLLTLGHELNVPVYGVSGSRNDFALESRLRSWLRPSPRVWSQDRWKVIHAWKKELAKAKK